MSGRRSLGIPTQSWGDPAAASPRTLSLSTPPHAELFLVPHADLSLPPPARVAREHGRTHGAVEFGLKSWFCSFLVSCVASARAMGTLSLSFPIRKMEIITVPIS